MSIDCVRDGVFSELSSQKMPYLTQLRMAS